MDLVPTPIEGCFRVRLHPIEDARGYFVGIFDLGEMQGIDPLFQLVRINRSMTRPRGAIRGFHFQRPPHDEGKLIQCLRGGIFDVCIDLRPGSLTYLRWVGTELTAENQELMLIPRGCAHGFQTLQEDTLVEYFSTGRYVPSEEGGVRWDDPAIGVTWPLPCSMTSEKDAVWPLLPAR